MPSLMLPSFIALCGLLLAPLSSLHAQSAGVTTSGNHPAPLAIDGVQQDWTEFACWMASIQGPVNLERYVQEFLLELEFEQSSLELSNAEIEKRVQEQVQRRINATFAGDRQAWAAELQRLGQDDRSHLAKRRREMKTVLQQRLLVQATRVITPDMLLNAFDERYGPGGRKLSVSRIFLRTRAVPQHEGITSAENLILNEQAKAETWKRAQALQAQLEAGKSFPDSARELSDDIRTAPMGGALPRPLVSQDWPGLDPKLLADWQQGQVLPAFYSGGGYNFLRLEQLTITVLDSVRDELLIELKNAPADETELARLRSEVLANATIELLPEVRRAVSADSPRLGRPVALVNGQPLPREDFYRWLITTNGRPFARTFMEHQWAATQTARLDCEPSQLDVEQRIQETIDRKIEELFKGEREQWIQDLASKGISLENHMHMLQQRTRHSLRAEALLLRERQISDAMVVGEWEARYGAKGQSIDVRFLMRRIPEPAEGTITTQEELESYIAEETRKALALLTQLQERVADGEDFGALVRTHSQDGLTRERGGRSGSRFELHTWPTEVQTAIRSLAPGEVTAPTPLGSNFFLFELAGLVHVPFESVEHELRAQLQNRQPNAVEVAGFINTNTNGIAVDVLPGMVW
ncbi:MAG: hypothetical protein ACI9F9_000666 [Candidatus Paceibacteria bacterium]|jgi:hypothetical protein